MRKSYLRIKFLCYGGHTRRSLTKTKQFNTGQGNKHPFLLDHMTREHLLGPNSKLYYLILGCMSDNK
jgi:hypothetical protein